MASVTRVESTAELGGTNYYYDDGSVVFVSDAEEIARAARPVQEPFIPEPRLAQRGGRQLPLYPGIGATDVYEDMNGVEEEEVDDFYGGTSDGMNGTAPSGDVSLVVAAAGGVFVVNMVRWAAIVGGAALVRRVGALLGASRGRITRSWSQLPGWLRAALVILGIPVGADVAFDFGEGDIGLIPVPGFLGGRDEIRIEDTGGETLSQYIQRRIVGRWEANGVWFYRLDDGRLAVQNNKGVWKIWRPKKPVVLFTTGAGAKDLDTLLRADAILAKASKKQAAMLRRRGWYVTRTKPGS